MKKQNQIILFCIGATLVGAYLWKKHMTAVGDNAVADAQEAAPGGGGGGGGSVRDPLSTAVTAVAAIPMPVARVSTVIRTPFRSTKPVQYPTNSLAAAAAAKYGSGSGDTVVSTRPRIGTGGTTPPRTTGGTMPRTGIATPVNGRAVVSKPKALANDGKAAVNNSAQATAASNFSGDVIINPVFI